MPSPMWMEVIQSLGDLNRTKRWKKEKFTLSLLHLGHQTYPTLRHQSPLFSGLCTLGLTPAVPGSQSFDLELGVTTVDSQTFRL